MLPNADVTLGNGNIGGLVATSDGTIGICMTGVTEGTVVAGTPFLVTNKAAITALGLTTATNPTASKFFSELVAEAKKQGVNEFNVYAMLVSSSQTVADMADESNADGLVKLIDFANGKIRVVAVLGDDSVIYQNPPALDTTNGINEDCYTAASNMQTLLAGYAALPTQWPMRGVVGCTSFNDDATDLTDMTQSDFNRVSMFIGDTESGDGCALGILMGRILAIPVQRKISRKRSGSISSTTAYVGTTSADIYTSSSTISDRGFITWRTFTNTNGFFFTPDRTASPTTDDYHFLCRGRTIDKAHVIVYAVYAEEVDEDVLTNDDGTIDANVAKTLEAECEKQLKLGMIAQRNITSADAFVDTTQNVVSTGSLDINVQVGGKGYLSNLNITLGYAPTE